MLNWSSGTRVFVATAPVDLRASFNRLFALTQSVLQQDPLSGHWFVFTNQERNRVKVLFWDGSGLWVCAKLWRRDVSPGPKLESRAHGCVARNCWHCSPGSK